MNRATLETQIKGRRMGIRGVTAKITRSLSNIEVYVKDWANAKIKQAGCTTRMESKSEGQYFYNVVKSNFETCSRHNWVN